MRFDERQLQRLGDFQAWKEGEDGPATLLDYAAYTATPDQLFGFAALYFRAIVEFDGHCFFADVFDEAEYTRRRTCESGREIQRAMNEFRISTLLGNADVDDTAADDCAQLLANAWNEVHGRKGVVAEVHGETLADLVVTLVNGHE